jgi:hypothetical protein
LFEGRATIGYDGEVFYLGLALDSAYVEGFVEGCLKRISENSPEEERILRELWADETQRDAVVESLNAWCELSGESLSGRCPPFRVGLPPRPEGKGTDSS